LCQSCAKRRGIIRKYPRNGFEFSKNVYVEDIVAFMVARADADVAATLDWLDGEDFKVLKQSGGASETFGNAQVEFQRSELGVRITVDRGEWKLDVAPPGFEFLNLEYLLTAKDGEKVGVPPSEVVKPASKDLSWHQTLSGLVAWIEEEDRTEALEGAKEAWRVHVRQYWATFDPKSGR
jgi:hypothetical protein